jgi:predicted RND superfamily exporter protein
MSRSWVENSAITVAYSAVFWLFFLNAWMIALFFASLILNSVVTLGLSALLGIPIDILTSNFFIICTLSVLEDFVFLACFLKLFPARSPRFSFRKLLIPSFFTSLTTFIGFASLAPSPIPMVRGFGALVGLSVMLEWFLLFFVIFPLLARRRSIFRVEARSRAWAWLERLSEVKLPRWVGAVSLLAVPLAVLALPGLRVQEAAESNLPPSHEFWRSHAYFIESRGIKTSFSVLFRDQDPELIRRALD